MQTRDMMQKRLESILDKETLQIAFHIEISKQPSKKQTRIDTTRQDMSWRDSLHGSSVDSTELESDMKELQRITWRFSTLHHF